MPIDTSSMSNCMKAEIKHLKAKGYAQDRAVAAASSICKKAMKEKISNEIEMIKRMIKCKRDGTDG